MKRLSILFIFVLIFFSLNVFSQSNYDDYTETDKGILLKEEFDDNINHWNVQKNKDWTREIRNGNYFITSHQKKERAYDNIAINIKENQDFEIDIRIKRIKYSTKYDEKGESILLRLTTSIPKAHISSLHTTMDINIGMSTLFYESIASTPSSPKMILTQYSYPFQFSDTSYNFMTIRRVGDITYLFAEKKLQAKLKSENYGIIRFVVGTPIGGAIAVDFINISYLNFKKSDIQVWQNAMAKNTTEDYEDFLRLYESDSLKKVSNTDSLVGLANQAIERIKWKKIANNDDTVALNQYLKDYPNGAYKSEALTKLNNINLYETRKKDFIDKSKSINSISGWNTFISQNENKSLAKYDFFYKSIDQLEGLIIKDINEKGILSRYAITAIKPLSAVNNSSKIGIIGQGSMPIMNDFLKDGQGIKIKMIAPVEQNSDINFVQGSAKMKLKTDFGNMSLVTGSEDVTFVPTYNDDGYNINTAKGAQWDVVSFIIQDGKIDEGSGVGIRRNGKDEIKIGAMYPSDGNIIFETIKIGNEEFIMAGGTSGSVHRFIGRIAIGSYTFIGEEDTIYPLTFLLDSKYGYIYLRGKGKVLLPSGEIKEFK